MRFARLYLSAVILSVLSPFAASSTQAAERTYGAEFTFTNDKMMRLGEAHIVEKPYQTQKREQLFAEIYRRCAPHCKKSAASGLYWNTVNRITFADGWWLQIASDPHVIEIQMAPNTVGTLRTRKNLIQNIIFDAAAILDLYPHRTVGGGHIHIGAFEAFEENPKLFRNFLVDQANHPELAMGILANDARNANPIGALLESQRKEFKRVIDDYDKGYLYGIEKLAKAVEDRVYKMPGAKQANPKYQAFNMRRLVTLDFPDEDKTVELRGFNPQKSADDFLRQVELIDARIDVLSKQTKLVDVQIPRSNGLSIDSQAAEQFQRFVLESGLDWNRYADYLPNSYRSLTGKPIVAGTIREAVSIPKRGYYPAEFAKRSALKNSCTYRTVLDFMAR